MAALPWPKLELEAAVAAGGVQHHTRLARVAAAEAAIPILLWRCAEQSQPWELAVLPLLLRPCAEQSQPGEPRVQHRGEQWQRAPWALPRRLGLPQSSR